MDGLSAEMKVTIVLDGEVDLAQAERFDNLFDRALLARPNRLVLDIHAVSFIDGRSIGVVSSTAVAMDAYGGVLLIAGATPFHRRLFDAVGLGNLLD